MAGDEAQSDAISWELGDDGGCGARNVKHLECIFTTQESVWSRCFSENSRAMTLSQSVFLADSRDHQDSHNLKNSCSSLFIEKIISSNLSSVQNLVGWVV